MDIAASSRTRAFILLSLPTLPDLFAFRATLIAIFGVLLFEKIFFGGVVVLIWIRAKIPVRENIFCHATESGSRVGRWKTDCRVGAQ